MQLRAFMYVEGEWNPFLLGDTLPPDVRVYGVPAADSEEIMKGNLQNGLDMTENTAENVILIAATDLSVHAGKQLGMAVAGYSNPLFPGQAFAGVQMVIEGFEEVDFAFLERVYDRCHGIPWEIARTKRCIIRELALADLEALQVLYDQQGVTWRLDEKGHKIPGYIEPLYSMEEEKEYQEAYISNMYGYYGYGMWLVTDRASGKLIGRAGLEHREYDGEVELEMGYLIAPQWQRQGIATEVCHTIIDYARQNLDFPRLNALTDETNRASIALLERLGFHYLEDTDVSGSHTRRYVYIF